MRTRLPLIRGSVNGPTALRPVSSVGTRTTGCAVDEPVQTLAWKISP